jgi:uncharacterized membrane protein SpoIIM required for sporulation
MTLGTFVRSNRPNWQRLEAMLGVIEAHGPDRLHTNRAFLRELSSLYRSTTGDLAYAQTRFRGTTILLFLHQLVARAHNQVYRPHRVSFADTWRFFWQDIPRVVRGHLSAVAWSAILFLLGIALGLSAVQFDERAASLILPSEILDSIYSGKMWTGNLFSVVPAPVASTLLFTNNISVALIAFAGGLTFGLVTATILFMNGFMLGVAFKLCANYGLLGGLLAFVAGHGFLEISAIILSGGGGFVLAHALLRPGSYTRSDALAREGRAAMRMAVACVPALLTAGCIEAFVSPSGYPVVVKATLGLALGIAFWLYLMLTGRATDKSANPSAVHVPAVHVKAARSS